MELSAGEDRISALDDDMLLLVLARLRCYRAAARTAVLSRRWRGLWTNLRHIVFRDVPFPSLVAALGHVPRPPPGLSLLEIRVTGRRPWPRPDAASLLCAAATLEPRNLVVALPSGYAGNGLPAFFLRLPAHVGFPALETLSLSGCHVRFDSLLPHCPRLRVLSTNDTSTLMPLHSASLQELFVDAEEIVLLDTVDIVAPQLKQLAVSLVAFGELNVSIVAPLLDKFSWQFSDPFNLVKFGLWGVYKLRLHTAETQGELPSLHIHARITSSVVHAQVEVENSMKEIEKHLIASFSGLELHLRPKGHVFGAFVLHLLGMNRGFRAVQRLKVILQRSGLKQECPIDCACDRPNWRSQTISLTALEEVQISGFEGGEHEIDFLNLIFTCAPKVKRMIVGLSHQVSSRNDGCTQIYNIFNAYSSVECHLYLSSGLVHVNQDCPSA